MESSRGPQDPKNNPKNVAGERAVQDPKITQKSAVESSGEQWRAVGEQWGAVGGGNPEPEKYQKDAPGEQWRAVGPKK